MSHAAELERFMRLDERLARIGRLLKGWPCRRARHPGSEDSPGGFGIAPCWTAHKLSGDGPWILVGGGDYLTDSPPSGARLLRGARVHVRETGEYGTGYFIADVRGYCPPCRARERLLILRRLWTPKRTAALKSLRAAFKRSPACAPVDPPVHALTAEQARALVRFAEADAALVRSKAEAAEAMRDSREAHQPGEDVPCWWKLEGQGGRTPTSLEPTELAKCCPACQGALRTFWRRHEAFRRRGSRLRILRPYFAQPNP